MIQNALFRLQANWVYGGAIAGLLLLVLAPLLTSGLTPAGSMVFFGLSVYMLHQYEEHDNDRFRHFVNATVLRGREGMTVPAVFVINIFGVWAVMAATLWATERFNTAFALISGYFLLINGAGHIIAPILLRRAVPGLWSALALFLPVGVLTLQAVSANTTPLQHILSILLILGLHSLIIPIVWMALKK
jgi:Protein of unknown function with HXXEE motif